MAGFRITPPPRARRAPDLTPVMDVVFILVVFFLVVSTFSETLVKPMQVSVPGSSTPASAPLQTAVLELTASGATLDAEPVAIAQLSARLAQLASRPLVIVTGDGAPYQSLVDALDAAQAAGLSSVKVQTPREVAR